MASPGSTSALVMPAAGSPFTLCPECGATVYYAIQGHEQHVAIPVGAFAEPEFPPPAFSVYEERMHSWVTMPEDIEHVP